MYCSVQHAINSFCYCNAEAQNHDRLTHKLAMSEAISAHMAAGDSTTKRYGKGGMARTPSSANTISLLGGINKDIDEYREEVVQLMSERLCAVKGSGTVFEPPPTKRRCGTKAVGELLQI